MGLKWHVLLCCALKWGRHLVGWPVVLVVMWPGRCSGITGLSDARWAVSLQPAPRVGWRSLQRRAAAGSCRHGTLSGRAPALVSRGQRCCSCCRASARKC